MLKWAVPEEFDTGDGVVRWTSFGQGEPRRAAPRDSILVVHLAGHRASPGDGTHSFRMGHARIWPIRQTRGQDVSFCRSTASLLRPASTLEPQ